MRAGAQGVGGTDEQAFPFAGMAGVAADGKRDDKGDRQSDSAIADVLRQKGKMPPSPNQWMGSINQVSIIILSEVASG
jgi:hypothetical protein